MCAWVRRGGNAESISLEVCYVKRIVLKGKKKLTMICLEIDVLKNIFYLLLSIFDERVDYVVHCCCSHVDTNLYRLGDVGGEEK